jgi:ribonuclease P protein component
MTDFRFKREERLKSQKIIGSLFKEGQSFGQYPLRLIWRPIDDETQEVQVQFTVSVAKKKFPHAVDRNRLRRQVREAYRLQKHLLHQRLDVEKPGYALMALYTATEKLPYTEIAQSMERALRRLGKILAQTHP